MVVDLDVTRGELIIIHLGLELVAKENLADDVKEDLVKITEKIDELLDTLDFEECPKCGSEDIKIIQVTADEEEQWMCNKCKNIFIV